MRTLTRSLILAAGLVLPWHAATRAENAPPNAPEAPPPPGIAVGDTAPDFTLRDQQANEVSLRSFRGKKSVVLAFYVFAFTGG